MLLFLGVFLLLLFVCFCFRFLALSLCARCVSARFVCFYSNVDAFIYIQVLNSFVYKFLFCSVMLLLLVLLLLLYLSAMFVRAGCCFLSVFHARVVCLLFYCSIYLYDFIIVLLLFFCVFI